MLLPLFALATLYGCGTDDCCGDKLDFGYDFFPINTGEVNHYRIDSTIYLFGGNEIKSTSHILRETISEEKTGPGGATEYKVRRELFDSTSNSWKHTGYELIGLFDTKVERALENSRMVVLGFPVKAGQRWNGLIYKDRETVVISGADPIRPWKDWPVDFFISEIVSDKVIGSEVYDEVAIVIQADHDFDLERRLSVEYYAKGIGLIYKKEKILDTQCTRYPGFSACLEAPWIERAEKGYVFSKTLIGN